MRICRVFFWIDTFFHVLLLAAQPENLSGIPYRTGSSIIHPNDRSSFPQRIEFQTITVDDMHAAEHFYLDILGGVAMDLERVDYYGAVHAAALFDNHEFEHAPDISEATGSWKITSRFIVFGNGLVQLLMFSSRGVDLAVQRSVSSSVTSPCIVGAAHIDFWIQDHVPMPAYIQAVESAAATSGLENVQWNRPIRQRTPSDRFTCPIDAYANTVVDVHDGSEPFGGLSWSYFKGPVGEQLELYRITKTMKRHIGQAYCKRGAVSHAFVDTDKNVSAILGNTSELLLGIFQHGFRTDDLHASVGFYTQVLGGNLIDYPVHGMDIRGDAAHWMILANETLTAYALARESNISETEAMNELGVANISHSGSDRLDHRFILFDNFVVEPLLYTRGLSFGGQVFEPRAPHVTSPATVGCITAAFGLAQDSGLDDGLDSQHLAKAVEKLKERAIRQGFPHAHFPTNFASFESDHAYAGLSYGYGKGPAGESLNYVQIAGPFRKKLEQALLHAGAVSTAFPSTNVHANGEMESYCHQVGVQ